MIKNNYNLREVEYSDLDKGILKLISQLSTIGVTYEKAKWEFDSYCEQISNNKNQKHYVIEVDGSIIASGTLLIENKIIHDFKNVGHIEDIIIHKNYRKKGYGKIIMEKLIDVAKNSHCYKVILNCNPECENYYKKFGLSKKYIQMARYFKVLT